MTGYRVAQPAGAAAYGGLTDWAVGRLGIPAFTLECGEGKNPLTPDRFARAYCELRPLLIRAPLYAAPRAEDNRPTEDETDEHRGL